MNILPGVITGNSLPQMIAQVETVARQIAEDSQQGRPTIPLATIEAPVASLPVLVGSMDAYNIVEYEGWFYGMPQALGEVNLQQVDVLEMPGVVRDLSREVVEGEIRELACAIPKQVSD